MTSSLANYRRFFSPFRHIPPFRIYFPGQHIASQENDVLTGGKCLLRQNRDKIGTKSLQDGSQDICKGTESNLGPVAGI